MVRDFSQTAENALHTTMDAISSDNWNQISAWFPTWGSYQSLAGKLGLTGSFNGINNYHLEVLNKCQQSKAKVSPIFQDARDIDSRYSVRLAACAQKLTELQKLLLGTAVIISPENGTHISADMLTSLTALYTQFQQNSRVLDEIVSPDGLTQEEASEMDSSALRRMLEALGQTIIALTPNVKVGQELRVPISADTVVYYSVTTTVNTNSNVDLNLIAEDQQLKFKNFSGTIGDQLKLKYDVGEEGLGEVSLSNDNTEITFDVQGGFGGEASIKVGNDTYSVKFSQKINTVTFEESVTTEVDGGSVKSTIGIEKSLDNGWKDVPVPVPITVETPDVVYEPRPSLPSFDVDWETVGVAIGTVIVIAGVGVFIYSTGGWGALVFA